MSELLTLAQLPPSLDIGASVDSLVKLSFAAAVAWYLLTQTTKALQSLTAELSALRNQLTVTTATLTTKLDDISRDIREVQDAINRTPGATTRGR